MDKKILYGTIGAGIVILLLVFFSHRDPTAQVNAADGTNWYRGSDTAPVTLLEYGDFQCPACSVYEPLLQSVRSEYGDRVKMVFRHYPLIQVHQNAFISAKAAEAAGAQGKFWDMHDVLYNTQKDWSDLSNPRDMFATYANSLGLNVEQFKADLDNKALENKIVSDMRLGDQDNITGTPSFFLNGVALKNPQSLQEFETAINDALENAPVTTTATSSL